MEKQGKEQEKTARAGQFAKAAGGPGTGKLICLVCRYEHPEEVPPKRCPWCGAKKDKFVPIDSLES
ncbi:MAG: rubredoxin-like domain-containing protein [Bacillota bacterium]|uniref:rubredoxin-like domain-containing protein n=1 Tax=Desulfurispora thermophila TaxID=265470 RepID=UPI0003798A14|nr:hypothetical protein [Desulfurispora thermophila]